MINYVNKLKEETNSECVEVTDLCARFTGENVLSSGFGIEGNAFLQKNPELYKILGVVEDPLGLKISMMRTYGLLSEVAQQIFRITFVGLPTPKLFSQIIADTISERTASKLVRLDYLNSLIEMRNRNLFGTNELPGHAFTMFLDGFQTSFAAMAYALLELVLNPHIQDIARNEVHRVTDKYEGKLPYNALQELEYIENVLYETLRKHPIIKFMARQCTKQYELKVSGDKPSIVIDKGTLMFISVRGIHYDRQYYPEPHKFDPDRFKQKGVRSKCSYFGFGEGPRICLGRRFAIAQVVSGLASILHHYDLKLNKRTKFPLQKDYFHISDVPVSGIYIDFIKRPSRGLD